MKRRAGGDRPHRARAPRQARGLWLFGLIGVALLTSGCLTTSPAEWIENGFKVGPNYGRPPAPVADAWIQANDPRAQSHHRLCGAWWSVFRDDTLNRLIDTAYNNNLTLRVAGTRILEARARQAIAVGTFFPQTQQMNGQYNRVNLSPNAPNNPLASFQKVGLSSTNNPFTNHYSEWTTGFNLSWELDFWGRFRRAIESANANLDASVENFDDALVTLLADVATNYLQYRIAQQRIKIARDNVRIQEGVLALVEQQFAVGVNRVTKLDVDQAKTVLQQTRSTIPALEIVQGQANDVLCILLGVPPQDLGPQLGPGPELGRNPAPNTPTWVAVGVPAELLRRRPDIRAAEREVAAQSAQIGVAEADLYPTIAINGTIGYDAQDLSRLFNANSFAGNIAPNFKWNILNYGRILNNVHLQEARLRELIAAYQNRVLTAGQETQTALRGFLRSQEQAESLARGVTAAKEAAELGVQQYRSGTVTFNTVFNLQITQVNQQDQLAIAQGNVALFLINTYRALGGGWEVRYEKEQRQETKAASAPAAPALPTNEQLPGPRPLPPG